MKKGKNKCMIHKMKLKSKPFYAVKSGYKTIELRLNDEKRQKLKIGDSIEFSLLDNPEEKLVKKIIALHKFSNFTELYQNLPLLKCGETPFTVYYARPEQMEIYYSKEQQAKYQVLGIVLEEQPLQRFLSAQTGAMLNCSSYETALQEVKSGLKTTHWMWYVFPQIQGLGISITSKYYALKNKKEAQEYLAYAVLGTRLIEITSALLKLEVSNLETVFGITDTMKVRSCMTLFDEIAPELKIFREVLKKFCHDEKDNKTIQILSQIVKGN